MFEDTIAINDTITRRVIYDEVVYNNQVKKAIAAFELTGLFPEDILRNYNESPYYPLLDKIELQVRAGEKMINMPEVALWMKIIGYEFADVVVNISKYTTEQWLEKIQYWRTLRR